MEHGLKESGLAALRDSSGLSRGRDRSVSCCRQLASGGNAFESESLELRAGDKIQFCG